LTQIEKRIVEAANKGLFHTSWCGSPEMATLVSKELSDAGYGVHKMSTEYLGSAKQMDDVIITWLPG
jgi:hypothetical protein